MGSGTTLLRMMLDTHEHIGIPHETGFMRGYKALRFIPFKWTGYGWALRMGWTKDELDAEIARFFDGIFQRYLDVHGKRRWGEKTPLHTWHIDSMARLYPDAVFVGLVRHPGAAVASNMSRFRHTLRKAESHYLRYNKEIARQAARFSDRFVLMRYEELLLHTEPALRELLEWLGEPWSENLLRHHEVQAAREVGRYDRVEGMSQAEPVDPTRLDKWARKMPAEQRTHIAERLGRIGELFGYSMDDPLRLDSLHDRPSHLISGSELEARFARFGDLAIEERGRVPSYEQYYNPRHFLIRANKTGEAPRTTPKEPGAAPAPAPTALRRALLPVARRIPPRARRRLRGAARRLRGAR
jgi:hypothetical protein